MWLDPLSTLSRSLTPDLRQLRIQPLDLEPRSREDYTRVSSDHLDGIDPKEMDKVLNKISNYKKSNY